MKNQKGISLIKIIIIIIAIIIAICLIGRITETNHKKTMINEFNDAVADYNLNVLKKNKIILTYYPNASSDLLFKEISKIPLDTVNAKNYDLLMEAYISENKAVREYNDSLLEYYRTILNEN